ncbi:MAG TPA: pyridoxamine 5'-phosphate oxidase family protein [Rubrobacteraceae bacterium]|nr:pyridoxamine 5'-phosphate oxidase family protein [Rubrobacteraceae bacterium]
MIPEPERALELPSEVEEVFREFRTCEMSTLARDGTPITWPTLPFWYPDEGRFLITTSIGLPQKAYNVRRNRRVSLLFSDPTASGLTDPPRVLVQGDAEAPDEVVTTLDGFEDELGRVLRRQPAGGFYSSNLLTRYVFEWYYMRLMIHVRPRRILWWPGGDFGRQPTGAYRVG